MAENKSVSSKKASELDWVAIREEDYPSELPEATKEKLVRKMKENPFVPIGCVATVGALTYGLYNFYKGRSQMSQYMMRARVLAQAFTFVAIVTGIAIGVQKKTSPTLKSEATSSK
ncbi:hypothetical protein KPH14_008947 [Odynerus spinipes]|uniref:HIG1 domain-containing protein n=1 Tax=Odynerus spinipes TaxID=1348599 RepID=A0AAD9RN81_9HYME|nr:hypothetical protein KPH14_008947 [Odynerus spinipes]